MCKNTWIQAGAELCQAQAQLDWRAEATKFAFKSRKLFWALWNCYKANKLISGYYKLSSNEFVFAWCCLSSFHKMRIKSSSFEVVFPKGCLPPSNLTKQVEQISCLLTNGPVGWTASRDDGRQEESKLSPAYMELDLSLAQIKTRS